jgi:hypothetical protein
LPLRISPFQETRRGLRSSVLRRPRKTGEQRIRLLGAETIATISRAMP